MSKLDLILREKIIELFQPLILCLQTVIRCNLAVKIFKTESEEKKEECMKPKILIFYVSIACLALFAGCANSPSSESKKLESYSKATLVPGKGLGNLELGKTTLGWFAENVGSGMPSALITDEESAIELTFLNGEMSVSFSIKEACAEATGTPGRRFSLTRDIRDFLKQYPACKDITLSSISVAATGNDRKDTFFKGITDLGVQLWSPAGDIGRLHGKSISRAGQMVAGEAFTGNFERVEFPSGIYFYYFRGTGPTAGEVTSGNALPPERLREIQESANKAAENAVVKRMTVFIPDRF